MFQIKHLMSTQVVSISPNSSIDEAMARLVQYHLDAIPVVDPEGKPIGLVTSWALLDFVFHCWPGQPRLSQYMKTPCPSVDKEDSWSKAAELFRSENLRTLPVTEQGRLVGFVSAEDLVRTIHKARSLVREVLAEQRPEKAALL
ncbi:MAG: CBS domain-containing protein [Thermoguttaceae bacterium]|nr:CBS domain-containing protein [Thermoguttaceae bacterium]MDW8039772.1 CBS domain-containing protein [Thermoguttaceae bacterium]